MTILYLVTAFIASLIGSISGIGGGVIIKPVLDFMADFNLSAIGFLSSATVLAMSVFRLYNSRKDNDISFRISGLLAIGAVIGGVFGKYLFDIIQAHAQAQNLLGTSQSVILLVLNSAVLITSLLKKRITSLKFSSPVVLCLSGIFMGSLAAFLGIGGGPINLMFLFLLFSMDTKAAAINSIFIIFFSQAANLLFTVAGGSIPVFPLPILLLMMSGGIGGGILGAMISRRMSARQVDMLFIAVTVLIIALTLRNSLYYRPAAVSISAMFAVGA